MTQTVQPEQRHDEPGARNARPGVSRLLRPVARTVVVLAALLAFGVFGLLVVVWRAARGKQHAEQSCPSCR
ncbi:MAG: hypothetical protein L0K86_02705, partial [Actinomycetia bacterium]|nr:hypothetical protein [Actinomycetes bacterium]